MYDGRRILSTCGTSGGFVASSCRGADEVPVVLLEVGCSRQSQPAHSRLRLRCPTGDAGGDWTVGKVGVGSRVERAEAPLSPLRPSPTALEARRGRGRGMLSESAVDFEGWSIEAILGKDSMAAEVIWEWAGGCAWETCFYTNDIRARLAGIKSQLGRSDGASAG